MLAKFCKWLVGLFIKKPPEEPVIIDPNKRLSEYTNAELVAKYGKEFNEQVNVTFNGNVYSVDRKSFKTHPKIRYYMDLAKEDVENGRRNKDDN